MGGVALPQVSQYKPLYSHYGVPITPRRVSGCIDHPWKAGCRWMEELRAELERVVGEVHWAGKHGMDEFRPELKRVAGEVHWVGNHGMEEFRPELERVAGEVHWAGNHGMEELRPELERVAAGIHWAGTKMGWRSFVPD